MDLLATIKEQIAAGATEKAISTLNEMIRTNPRDANLYYLRGNAYRKKSDWKHAMSNYLEAKEINPESPATEALEMLSDILNFYNKDIYNQ